MSSPRRQRRIDGALAACLGRSTALRAYAGGRVRARPSPLAAAALVAFVASVVSASVVGAGVLVAAAVLAVLFVGALKPYRGCAVTDSTVVLVGTDAAGHLPRRVLAQVPHGALFPPNITAVGTRAVRVNLGAEIVHFRRADYDRLAASVADSEKGSIVAIPDGRLA